MNLQYILDSTGKTTGVFIPIEEWNELKNKYKGIAEEESTIPEWHKQILNERIEDYENSSKQMLDFDKSISDIEKDL